MLKVFTITSIIIFIILGFLSLGPVIMSPMMFDRPGSEKDNLLWVLFYCVITFPLVVLFSEGISIYFALKGNYYRALIISLIPLINFLTATIVLIFYKSR